MAVVGFAESMTCAAAKAAAVMRMVMKGQCWRYFMEAGVSRSKVACR